MAGAENKQEAAPGSLVCPDPAERPDLWPWTAARREDGILEIGGVPLTEIAGEQRTPVFVLDHVDLAGRAGIWATAMAEEFWDGYGLSGGEAFYAGKAFLCADVARTVSGVGMGIDTASLGELTTALRAGVDPSRIGLHGNNKSDAEIELALSAGDGQGIARLFIDAPEEVGRVDAIAARLGVTARVMVRLKTGVHAGGHEFIATSHEDQKFGVSIADDQAMDTIRAIVASEHLQLLGLHNHIGSQIMGTEAFAAAIRIILEFRARVERELGISIDEVDLGGGVGIVYTGQEPAALPLADVVRTFAKTVREECETLGATVPKISVEPGRSVIGPAMVTLYRVGTVKDVSLEGGGTRRYVSIDGGMSDNIRPALYGADYTATLANRANMGSMVRCRVVGKHCESGDIVVHDVDLPADIRRGDLLAVPATGAYGRSMASAYNMVPQAGVVAVENGDVRTLVRPVTIEDLLALDTDLA